MEFRKLARLFLLVISLTVDAAAQTSLELSVGAHLTMDSATRDKLGTGRWQLGAASVTISPHSWGLVGGLVTISIRRMTASHQNFSSSPASTRNFRSDIENVRLPDVVGQKECNSPSI